MANARYYSSVAPPTTLTGGIGPSNTTIQLASTAGLPGSLPFTLSLDYGAANEELVDVTAIGGLTATVTRAVDGTAASTHNIGAVVRHVTSARDFTESRTHEASSSGVHGVTGNVVGTSDAQTLSNKTLTRATGSLQNVNIFNTGTNTTAIIGDSVNPNIDRLQILDNEVSLNPMVKVSANGNVFIISPPAVAAGTYRLRITDSDGTTDRAAVLGGGTFAVAPTATTTFPGLDVGTPNASATTKALRIAGVSGGSDRFSVFNDGHTVLTGQTAGQTQFKVLGAASQSVPIFDVNDSGSVSLFNIGSTGRAAANKGMDVTQTSLVTDVFTVKRPSVSFASNMINITDETNATLVSINANGDINATKGMTVGGNLSVTGNLLQTATSIRYRPMVTGSATISFTTQTSNTTAVSFGATFTAAPNLAITINSGAGSTIGWMCRALNVTTTGFDLNVATNGTAQTWTNIPVMWTAIAP